MSIASCDCADLACTAVVPAGRAQCGSGCERQCRWTDRRVQIAATRPWLNVVCGMTSETPLYPTAAPRAANCKQRQLSRPSQLTMLTYCNTSL